MSFDVINGSSDYVIMPERNGRLNHISELLIDTQVSGKKFHPPFRLVDNVNGELRAMMNIFYFLLFYSTFLWIVGFHRAFIPDGTHYDMPLVYSTEEGEFNEIKWGFLQQNAFDALKKALVMQPILRMADLSNIVLYLIPQLFVISHRPLWFALAWGSFILDIALMPIHTCGVTSNTPIPHRP